MDFRTKVAQGIGWSAFASGIRQLFRFITSITLARLLLPDDFGLVAIALTIVNILWTFGEAGLWQALMRWDDDIELAANVAFILNLAISVLLTLLLYVTTPLIAISFFGNADLIPVIRILSVMFILNAIERVPACLMDKSFNFKVRTQIEAFAQVIYLITAVSLAYWGYGVWSLVGGIFAQIVVRISLTFWQSNFTLTWQFDKNIAKSLILFGQPLVYTALLVSVSTNIDQILVAKFVSLSEVGFYTVSFALSRIIMELPKEAIGRVMLPAYSAVQKDTKKLQALYLKSVQLSCLLVFVIAVGMASVAHLAIPLMYGPKWLPMIAYVYIWMIRLIFVSTYFLAGHMLVVLEKQTVLPWINVFQTGVTVIGAVLLGKSFGGLGVAIASTLAVVISAFMHHGITIKYLTISSLRLLDTLWRPTAVALGVGLIATTISTFVSPSYIGLFIVVLTGFLSYFLLLFLVFGKEIQDDFRLLQVSFSKGKVK